MCETLLKTMLEQRESLLNLLVACEIHLIPICNVDGTVVGNSTVNLGGIDISSKTDMYEGKII